MKVNDRYVSFYYESDDEYGEILMDKSKTALLVVDMQNQFIVRPKIDNPTPRDISEAKRWEPFFKKIDQETIPNNKKLIEAFRKEKMEVIYGKIQTLTKDGRERSSDHKATGYNDLLLRADDSASDIVKELTPLPDEIVVTKTTDSVLNGSALALWLRNMGIDTVVVTGVLLDQCVSCTVRDLAGNSFNVWLIEDASRASTQDIQDHELAVLNNIYCHVINTDECIEAITK